MSTAEARAEAAECALARQRYIALFYILPAVVGVAAAYACSELVTTPFPGLSEGWKHWAFVATVFMLPVCFSFLLSPYYVGRKRHLEKWVPVRLAHFVRKTLILAPLSTGSSAIYQGGVWDGVKTLFGIGT